MAKTYPKSDGWYHTQITYYLLPLAFFLGFCLTLFIQVPQGEVGTFCLVTVFGCYCGVYLSPDLDLTSLTTSEYRLLKLPLIGWLVGSLFIFFWLPYSLMMKHRSFFSHGPIIGTFVRIVYLLVGILVFGFLLRNVTVFGYTGSQYAQRLVHVTSSIHFVAWCAGLALSDIGHWLRDIGVLV